MTLADGAAPLISAVDLTRHFVAPGRAGSRRGPVVRAVDGVSFSIAPGETYSLVGESGCGKTTTARMMLLVDKPTSGNVQFLGKSLSDFSGKDVRSYRSSVQAVLQDPWSSLNPRMRVDDIIAEPLRATSRVTKAEARRRVAELLDDVGLRPSVAARFPHQFSGGQRQRIAIARALSSSPKLIVLDEPVSSLDVSIRAQIMNLLAELQKRYGISYLLIAHDLATVRYLSHRVGVMYLGKIVEQADSRSLFTEPRHPYSKALIAAALPAHPDAVSDCAGVLRGEVPSPINPPSGCAFHPRCVHAMPSCTTDPPRLRPVVGDREVSCHLY